MSIEGKGNTPIADGEFSSDAESTKGNEENRKLGHKILRLLQGIINKTEKPHSDNYLLSENVAIDSNAKTARKWWKKIYRSWDECGVDIPYDLGKAIEDIVKDPNYVFGVHHSNAISGKNYQDSGVLRSIMEGGLINMGDASSGSFYKNPPVNKTVSMCPDMFHAVMQIKGSYKGSTGAVLVVMPSKYVDENGDIIPGMEDEVYYTNKTGNSVIKPEYIFGFVQNLGKGSTCKFESRQSLLESYKKHPVGDDSL